MRWDLDTHMGYAASWTTGQSYLGFGTGLAAGVTLPFPVHFEVGAIYSAGSIDSAANRTIDYWSRQWSVLGHVAAGYDFALFARRLVARPQAIVGCLLLADTTRLGAETRGGLDPLFTLGPGASLFVRFGDLHAGIDAHAFFVPSRVAAPIGAVYGLFGVER
jgi:hypothetical protein